MQRQRLGYKTAKQRFQSETFKSKVLKLKDKISFFYSTKVSKYENFKIEKF